MSEKILGLSAIRDTVKQVAEVISIVLKVDVTIVDAQQRRIAATGKYRNRVDQQIATDSLFTKALKDGSSLVVTDTFRSEHCKACSGKDKCMELAHLCCPINANGRTVGLISLVAFTDKQRQRLLSQENNYINFIGKMANLLGSKLLEEESGAKLRLQKKQLEAIFESVTEGLVSVDSHGTVSACNKNAASLLQRLPEEMLGVSVEQIFPNSNIINLAGQGKTSTVTLQFKGARDGTLFLLATITPILSADTPQGAVLTLRTIHSVYEMANKVSAGESFSGFDLIIGASLSMRKALDVARKAAALDSTILIQGESGTGKELFARALHQESSRRNQAFVAINCGAIPDALLESELFGYEGGAFTGSRTGGKPGKLELADGGTIFLDEIGDMPIHLQVKLLRFLQDNRIERLGGTQAKFINARVIAATNQNLEVLMQEGRFRKDLYYRLNVVPIEIPPLRERKEEIALLVEFFLNKYSQVYAKKVFHISRDAYKVLQAYDWPGNVRELENCIEYAMTVCDGTEINLEHLPGRIKGGRQQEPGEAPDIMPLEQMEKELLLRAWQKYGNSGEGTLMIARALKIGRATVYRKLKKYGII